MKTGNKGEWSEAYTFVKLLGEGQVHVADKELNKIDKSYSIKKIYKDNVRKYYEIDSTNQVVKIFNYDGKFIDSFDTSKFNKIAEQSFKLIKEGKGPSFEVPLLKDFLNEIGIDKFKSSSKKKEDIKIEVVDENSEKSQTFTFSIKSHIGRKPSLLNASKLTNFTFIVRGLPEERRTILNSYKSSKGEEDLKRRYGEIFNEYERGKYIIEFVNEKDNIFYQNLRLINYYLPNILAYLLFYYYSHEEESEIELLINDLIEFNPLNLESSEKNSYKDILYKFLEAVTFGMRPGDRWDKTHEVTGGLLSVKKDGDILCLPKFFGEDYLKDYLFNSVVFDTGSTNKHDFGQLKRVNIFPLKHFTLNSKDNDTQIEEDTLYFKLNLLLKFK